MTPKPPTAGRGGANRSPSGLLTREAAEAALAATERRPPYARNYPLAAEVLAAAVGGTADEVLAELRALVPDRRGAPRLPAEAIEAAAARYQAAIDEHGGSVRAAARALGVAESSIRTALARARRGEREGEEGRGREDAAAGQGAPAEGRGRLRENT